MIAYPVAIASAPVTAHPIASASLDPRYHFARDRDRDRDREVLKSLDRYLSGLWLRSGTTESEIVELATARAPDGIGVGR